jgi:general secretion pathway protein H
VMSWRRRNSGFTLVELLVVLAMIALLVTLARPMYGAVVPSARVRADVLELAASLRQSRNRAISGGRTITVLFDTEQSRYSIESIVEELSTRTELKTIRPGDSEDGILRLEFYPDGSSTGASIELSGATIAFQLDVDWLTGRIRVAERDPDAS